MGKPTTMSLFCGAGGETMGKMLAFEEMGIRIGDTVAYALNHWDSAVQTHRQNFPGIECRRESIEEVTAADFGLAGQTIHMLWASPSCVHFSTARGGLPVSDQQRSHASEVIERFLKVADVKVLLLENVPEFRTWGPTHKDHSNGCGGRAVGAKKCPVKACHFEKPIKERAGEFFEAFLAELRGLGYTVEYRILCAADYGDPTIRKRFFLQAAKDGVPIRWPEHTHRNPKRVADLFDSQLPPWRTAAECIDFDLPCLSIFDRKKPLAENTLKRIAAGIERFVLQSDPFIVNLTHGARIESLDEPMKTITGARRGEKALVAPMLSTYYGNKSFEGDPRGCAIGSPVPTITTENRHALVTASLVSTCLVGVGGRAGQSEPRGPLQPFGTVTTKADSAFVAAHLVRTDMPQSNASCAYSVSEPLRTVTTAGGHAVVEASFVAKNFTGVVGHKPDQPLGTITGTDHNSLVTAHLVRLRGTSEYHVSHSSGPLNDPMTTLTGSGTHQAIVAAHLVQTGYGERAGQAPRVLDIQAPLGTVMATGQKHALVHALLTNTTGSAPKSPDEPLPSITTGQQQALMSATLIGIDQASSTAVWPADDPLSTITTKARHSVAAIYLTKFQQNSQGQSLEAPMDTVMAGAQRFGLVSAFLQRYGKNAKVDGSPQVTVMVNGQEYVLADICLRMLKPRELARAMGVPESFKFPKGMSQEKQVKMIGNMCPVHTVKALVRTIVEDRRAIFGLVAA